MFIKKEPERNINRLDTGPVKQAAKVDVKPKTVPSPLTGIEVLEEEASSQIVGLMIENSPEARPQSGLHDAGAVYETIAEGGITRFLALYQEKLPALAGPVRSLRPYYLSWALGYDAVIGHVGGSPEALAKVKTTQAKDMDEFSSSGTFYRATDRFCAAQCLYHSRKTKKLSSHKILAKN